MNRSFKRVSLRVPNAKPMPGYEIQCSKCGSIEKISVNTYGGSMAPEGIAGRFRNKGWIVGGNDGKDICPSCKNDGAMKRSQRQMKEKDKGVTSTQNDAPRHPSRDDKRVIFAKINDVYVDEKTGYDAGWTDARVARDLGVPVAWVANIREEHFGDECANPQIIAMIEEARSCLVEAKGVCSEMHDFIALSKKWLDERHNEFSAEMQKMEKFILKFDDQRKGLLTGVDRLESKVAQTMKALGK